MDTIKYLSAQEVSSFWGISKRRVQNLCVNNRIPGAVRIGNMWAIPSGTPKPKDARVRDHDEKTPPIGPLMRKARRCIKAIVEDSVKGLQNAGLSQSEALHTLIVFFATRLLNQFIDNYSECVSVCERFFDCMINPFIPERVKQSIDKFISENSQCLDDSLSWVYQFGSKIGDSFKYGDTQFFTEKYMITALVDSVCLDSESKVIDPACGGGNFLLYSFDNMVNIFAEESSPIKRANIALQNLCGYEIDAFLAYVAAFNLKMKAFSYVQSVSKVDISAFNALHPKIYYPKLDSIAGFLDLDWSTQIVVNCDSQLETELISAFDSANVVVTNPPFRTIKGMPTEQKEYLQKNYPLSKCDMCNAFIERALDVLPDGGKAAMVTQNSWMYLDSFTPLRQTLLEKYTVSKIWELGANAFYDLSGEKANVALVIFNKTKPTANHKIELQTFRSMNIDQIEESIKPKKTQASLTKQTDVLENTESRFDMFSSNHLKNIQATCQRYKDFAAPMQGTSTGDAKRLIDYYWRHLEENDWVLVSKGGGYSRYEGLNSYCVKWGKDGEYIKKTKGSAIRNANYFGQTQLVFSDTGTAGLNVRVLMPGQIFVASGPGIRIKRGNAMSHLAFLNSRFSSYFVRLASPKLTIAAGYIGQIPVTEKILSSPSLGKNAKNCLEAKKRRLKRRPVNVEFSYISHCAEQSIQDMAKAWFIEDLADEWTQLINEQEIEDEIAKEMQLSPDDRLAIDSYLGAKRVLSPKGEEEFALCQSDITGILGCDCLPKRTKARKNAMGADGLIELISQIKGISCERVYSALLDHFDWFANNYISLYLHSLILSSLDYRHISQGPYSVSEVILRAGITSKEDKAYIAEWIAKYFNTFHKESLLNCPIYRYNSMTASFERIVRVGK